MKHDIMLILLSFDLLFSFEIVFLTKDQVNWKFSFLKRNQSMNWTSPMINETRLAIL